MEDIVRRIVREELAGLAPAPASPKPQAPLPADPFAIEPLYSVAKVAQLLDVSTDYVYRAIKAGDIPVVELGSTRAKQRVRAEDLARFVADHSSAVRQHSQ